MYKTQTHGHCPTCFSSKVKTKRLWVNIYVSFRNQRRSKTGNLGRSPSNLLARLGCVNSQHSCYQCPRFTPRTRPYTDNVHPSVLDHEMMVIETGENSNLETDRYSQSTQSTHDHRFPNRDLVLFQTRCSTSGPGMTSSTLNSHVDIFNSILTVIIFKPVRPNP